MSRILIGLSSGRKITQLTKLLLAVCLTGSAHSQTFTKITDSNNPIVSSAGPAQYSGASWIDFDNDGRLDLFVNQDRLFRNNGGGNFERVFTNIGSGLALQTGNGNSWADYDNDGDLDVFISTNISALYRNDGNDVFTRVTTGEIGNGFANRGWSCAWADFDNDGYVDLAITHPAGFVQPTNNPTSNHLLRNDGPPNYGFTRITSGPIVTGLAAYTVGTWSDFDQDGDQDYFVGAGPATGVTARDFLYQNQLAETGTASFLRINTGVIATDLQDGQVWNWIDYDNDGDLDAYLTNWGGGGQLTGMRNRLYRNDSGTFTAMTTGNIVTDSDISLSSVWGDFDNDGDLDCYVANDRSQPDRYYSNNGDGTFTRNTAIAIAEALTHRGATAGDYDNDGDLDLLAVGPNNGTALYRNDTNNGNSWITLTCIGTLSNRAAIGTSVKAKAMIAGQPVWQMREILAQNNFNGQNSLRVHFGFGSAAFVDSLEILWPSGNTDIFTNVNNNHFYQVVEEGDLTPLITAVGDAHVNLPTGFVLNANYPNPFNPTTTITYELDRTTKVRLEVYNIRGERIRILVDEQLPTGIHSVNWEGRNGHNQAVTSGVYYYRLTAPGFVQTRKMVLVK